MRYPENEIYFDDILTAFGDSIPSRAFVHSVRHNYPEVFSKERVLSAWHTDEEIQRLLRILMKEEVSMLLPERPPVFMGKGEAPSLHCDSFL